MIDPWTIDELSPDEKLIAEKMLMEALETGLDRRWLYGLEQLATSSAAEFLLQLFNNHTNIAFKIKITKPLLRVDNDAPVLEFLHQVLSSNEPDGLRFEVISAIFWLKEVYFEDKKRSQLLLSIMYDGLVDRSERIRKYAYEILLEHYHLKEFTPIDDPIMKIISGNDESADYQEAMELFHKRAESMKVQPFSRDIIVQFINELPNNPPEIEPSECEVCSKIPEKVEADIADDESIDSYTSLLDKVVIFAYYSNAIKRCPICGRLYIYKYHYEYFACSENEEEEALFRSDTKRVIELVDSFINSYDFKRIIKCDIFLKISY